MSSQIMKIITDGASHDGNDGYDVLQRNDVQYDVIHDIEGQLKCNFIKAL